MNTVGSGIAICVALISSVCHGFETRFGQICWTYGMTDNRVYYAENYVQQDRSENFDTLMEYTGLYRSPTECLLLEVGAFEARRERMFRNWAAERIQLVNTTFLSDLDY